MTACNISYYVKPAQGGHRYFMTMKFTHSGGLLDLRLPIWIPGSYTRRDFSKHLSNLKLRNSNQQTFSLNMENTSKWTVELPPDAEQYELTYEVYARDVSVRGCYLDHERGVFNPCCACLYIEDRQNESHELTFVLQDKQQSWTISGADAKQGKYLFTDYGHLIDTPFMLAEQLVIRQFMVGEVSHEIIISGHAQPYDIDRLSKEVAQVCQEAVKLFGGSMPEAVTTYRFLLHLTDHVYGGLEHRASSMLMAPRAGLPPKQIIQQTKEYVRLLGLFSHEYFHTWNVKDLLPKDYQPYRLDQEQPTEMLWLFEGFTAYFDNWLLRQSDVISLKTYLNLLSNDISAYWQRRGRLRQTLAQSSYEAWTKLYNGGEDAVNTSTNYYVHGALMALCLDVFLRVNSNDDLTLAMVMNSLWQQFYEDRLGLDENLFREKVARWLPESVQEEFQSFLTTMLHSHEILPLHWACRHLGLELQSIATSDGNYELVNNNHLIQNTSDPGFRWQESNQIFKVSQLDGDSLAAESGLAVGDELLAVNHFKATPMNLYHSLMLADNGDEVVLHVFRDGYLYRFKFKLSSAIKTIARLKVNKYATPEDSARRRRWTNQFMQEFS